VVDGCPAGLPLDTEDIRRELRRRRPGGGGAASARAEPDEPEILSGVFEGKTLGTPIAILVRNQDHRSADYDRLRDLYRPGHADWTWEAKYGVRDPRGGGRSSGRETLGRVAAGAVAKALLARWGIGLRAWTASIAGIEAPGPEDPRFDEAEAERNPLRVPHRETLEKMLMLIEELRERGDSAGGTVCCVVRGLPPGLGEPVFAKLDACLGAAMLSIGAAKGVEFGAGFAAAASQGSLQNDRPLPLGNRDGDDHGGLPNDGVPGGLHNGGRGGALGGLPPGVPALGYETNRAGGVLGGISTGMPLEFRVAFKPIASIAQAQKTVDRAGAARDLEIQGRHDICVCPRAVPVVEAMAAMALADLLLIHRSARV
jgi:chorismate synthase